jgi:hypothetical protein
MLQWIVDAYALVFAGLLLTAGAATASGARGAARRPRRVRHRVRDQWVRPDRPPSSSSGGRCRCRAAFVMPATLADHRHLPAGGGGDGPSRCGSASRAPERSARSSPVPCSSGPGGARPSSSTCPSSP